MRIYRITEGFPKIEQYRLVDQCVGLHPPIPLIIVEGCGRESDKVFRQFLVVTRGSANEMKYHLLLAKVLSYISENIYNGLVDIANKLVRSLTNLIKKL